MRRALALLLLALGGCYDPAFVSGKLLCDEAKGADACPSGFSCQSGRCYREGDGPDGGAQDLAADPGDGPASDPDLTAPRDLAEPRDLVTVDLSGPPCPGGGVAAGVTGKEQEVYACKGMFAKGSAATTCGVAYRPCTSSDVSRISISKCEGAGGFYATNIEGGIKSANQHLTCPSNMASPYVLIGCGSEDGTTVPSVSDCFPFTTAFPCDKGGVAWSCNAGTKLDSASHSDATKGGVLCCRM